jgi:hypothetical protein
LIGLRTTSEHRISTYLLPHFPGQLKSATVPISKCLKGRVHPKLPNALRAAALQKN